MPAQDERMDPVTLFPQEMQQGVADLAYLGYLTKPIDFCGNVFVMETIRPYMKFHLAQVLEPYRNTLKEPEVWAALHVGTALTSINGRSDFCPPVGDNPRAFVEARMYWLIGPSGYWQPTIDYLFGEYAALEQEQMNAIAEFHRLSQRSRGTSQPLPDSLIAPGPSSDETAGDSQLTEPSS